MYTSISKVRILSGFTNTTRMPNSVVLGKIRAAESIMDGAIAKRYVLPIPYHRQNVIRFAGAGTGSGTMAIVINAVTYNITISNLITAEQCAQQLRDATSTDFYLDQFDDPGVVTIVSKKDSSDLTNASAQVNITAYPTTAGVSATVDGRSDRHCGIVEQTVAEYAAGMIMYQEYGTEVAQPNKDGALRIEAAGAIIDRIAGRAEDGKVENLLDDYTKQEFPTLETFSPKGYPNDASDADATNPTTPFITVNQKF